MLDTPPFPIDEEERLEALRRYRIVDTEPEPHFDRIAEIARRRFGVPMSFIGFVDEERLVFKARCDIPVKEIPRAVSFCQYAILDDDLLVVLDTKKDARFANNPYVVGGLNVRFYAGAPLVAQSGQRVGTICLIDTQPRESFSDEDRRDLADIAAVISDHLEMRLIVGDVHDEIEIRRAAEAKAHQLAFHDVLTGLPNRAFLQTVVADGLPFARDGVLVALAADLDDFKAVNDTFGHYAGDELLRRTANMIETMLGERAFVARISGDEFIALIDGDSVEAVQALAIEIVEKTATPFLLAGRMISNGVSLGVAFADSPAVDIDALLRNADLALCAAKRSGRRQAVIFDEKMATETRRLAVLKDALINAIKERSTEVFFQPIHAAQNGRMIGVEALLRWNHPGLGWIGPNEFIPLAEESGLIIELGDSILRTSLEAARHWQDIFVSVNLSPVQFRLRDLAAGITTMLADMQFPASRLQLEVTEGVLLDDFEGAKRQIEALTAIGVRVVLDDFGKGYSSLNYLADLPFKKVKIDHSFVTGARRDPKRHAIIKHIVALARALDMDVTAEGVETEDDAGLLTAAGCTSLQGFYFGSAVPAPSIDQRLKVDLPVA